MKNGLILSPPEMYKLKSCIRRRTDSIDKRFCFDIEVVERFVFSFCTSAYYSTFFLPQFLPGFCEVSKDIMTFDFRGCGREFKKEKYCIFHFNIFLGNFRSLSGTPFNILFSTSFLLALHN